MIVEKKGLLFEKESPKSCANGIRLDFSDVLKFSGQQYSRFNCYLCQVIYFDYLHDCTRRLMEVVTQTSVLNTILSHSELYKI